MYLRVWLHKHHRRRILDRDGWMCYLCHVSISPEFVYPHPLSATVDHVIPVSAGGTSADVNLRAAHWGCNEDKGSDMPQWWQVAM
jgi:5-methylcytosine-specific restriction endonuclease McrA